MDPPNKCPDQISFISRSTLHCVFGAGVSSIQGFQERVLVLLQTPSTSTLLTGELMYTGTGVYSLFFLCTVYCVYMLLGTYQITLPTMCSTCVQGNTIATVYIERLYCPLKSHSNNAGTMQCQLYLLVLYSLAILVRCIHIIAIEKLSYPTAPVDSMYLCTYLV